MSDYRTRQEARQDIVPNNKCPRCDSMQLVFNNNYPVMDVNPPIYTEGVKCLNCDFEAVYSWQEDED